MCIFVNNEDRVKTIANKNELLHLMWFSKTKVWFSVFDFMLFFFSSNFRISLTAVLFIYLIFRKSRCVRICALCTVPFTLQLVPNTTLLFNYRTTRSHDHTLDKFPSAFARETESRFAMPFNFIKCRMKDIESSTASILNDFHQRYAIYFKTSLFYVISSERAWHMNIKHNEIFSFFFRLIEAHDA